jgi:hypothetical protein
MSLILDAGLMGYENRREVCNWQTDELGSMGGVKNG